MSKEGSILNFIFAGVVIDILLGSDGVGHDKQKTDGTASSFIKQYYPLAISAGKTYPVPADFTISQAILESNSGTSHLFKNSNNAFGIKANLLWRGNKFMGYRAYDTPEDSFADHSKFLASNSRYKAAFNYTDPLQFAQAVATAGYAEDPQYINKIAKLLPLVQQIKQQLGIS